MLHMANPMLMASDAYAAYQARLAVLATGGSLPWLSYSSSGAGTFRSTAASAATSGLFGSSWQTEVAQSSYPGAAVRHGMESQSAYNALVSAGIEVLFTLEAVADGPLLAVNRNGLISSSFDPANDRARMTFLGFWDPALGRARRMNPYAGTGPTDWTP